MGVQRARMVRSATQEPLDPSQPQIDYALVMSQARAALAAAALGSASCGCRGFFPCCLRFGAPADISGRVAAGARDTFWLVTSFASTGGWTAYHR